LPAGKSYTTQIAIEERLGANETSGGIDPASQAGLSRVDAAFTAGAKRKSQKGLKQ